MVLASLAVAMFICSLLEELKPEESARNIIVDRGNASIAPKIGVAESATFAMAFFERTASSI